MSERTIIIDEKLTERAYFTLLQGLCANPKVVKGPFNEDYDLSHEVAETAERILPIAVLRLLELKRQQQLAELAAIERGD